MRLRAKPTGIIKTAQWLITELAKGKRVIVGKEIGKRSGYRDRATVTGSGLRVDTMLVREMVATGQLIQVEKGHWSTEYSLAQQI